MSRKEGVQVISDIEQDNYFVQAENHLDYLIREKWLPNSKRIGQVIKYQVTTIDRSQIFVSQQYHWHTMIEAEWEDLLRTTSTHDIFSHFAHYFQLNLDNTSFLCNVVNLKVIGSKDETTHKKICINSRFSITVFWVGSRGRTDKKLASK